MRLHILSKLKSKIFNFNFTANYDFLLLSIIFGFFWLTIGQYVELSNLFNYFTYGSFKKINFGFFDLVGIIHLSVFIILFFALIFKTIKNRKISFFVLLLFYPLSASIGYYLNITEYDSYGLMFHFFLTISNLLMLFANLIYFKRKEKIIEIFLNISFLFIIVFFVLLIIPDLINKVINNIHVRDIYFVNLNLIFFEYSYIQNSNGAARITLIILIFLLTKLIYKIEANKSYKKLYFLIFFISIVLFYYQSRISVIFYILFLLSLCTLNKKLIIKNRINLILSFIVLPFIIINIYNNFSSTVSKNIHLDVSQEYNLYKLDNFLNFENNRILSIYKPNIVNEFKSNELCVFSNNNKFFKLIDSYSSGRVCGWEILIKDFKMENILFGNGFFYDQIFLKKYQKLSSNTYLNIFYNSGIIGLISIFVVIFMVLVNLKKIINYTKHSNLKYDLSIYIIVYLLFRSLFEDTLAFTSIDLILFLNCLTLVLFKVNKSKII